MVTGTKAILPHCEQFFSELYRQTPHPQSANLELQNKFLKYVPQVITPEMSSMLDSPITMNELHKALTQMKSGSAPGGMVLQLSSISSSGLKFQGCCTIASNLLRLKASFLNPNVAVSFV